MKNTDKITGNSQQTLYYLSDETSRVVSFVPLRSWLKAATSCGFAIHPILSKTGISAVDSTLSETTISLDQSRRLIEACVAKSSRGHFPFVLGEYFAFYSIPEIETYVSTCGSLRDALKIFDWIRSLMTPRVRTSLHESHQWAELRVDLGSHVVNNKATIYFTETWLASTHKLICELFGQSTIERILLRHSRPPYIDAYNQLFGVELRFDQPQDAIVLRRELLDQPLMGVFPEIHREAEAKIKLRISQLLTRTGISGELERLLLENTALLSGTLEECATILGLHVRTLQRRLHEEDQNFSDLQNKSKYRLACLLLSETELDFEYICDRLGFSERRAFTRAFKRWSGQSPSAYRKAPAKQLISKA